MARLAMINKAKRKPKFSTRQKNRCSQCGRARGFYRDFGVCRVCVRKLALNGQIPGMIKASW